jgi:hypothetical protein
MRGNLNKLALFISLFFISVMSSEANDFLDKLRSGEIKRNYAPGAKKDTSNFLEDLRSGKIQRNYPKNTKKADPKFLEKLRSGEIKRDYNASGNSSNGKSKDESDVYNKRGKKFIDDINVDHMLKNKNRFSEEDLKRIKEEQIRKAEKEKFLKRIKKK